MLPAAYLTPSKIWKIQPKSGIWFTIQDVNCLFISVLPFWHNIRLYPSALMSVEHLFIVLLVVVLLEKPRAAGGYGRVSSPSPVGLNFCSPAQHHQRHLTGSGNRPDHGCCATAPANPMALLIDYTPWPFNMYFKRDGRVGKSIGEFHPYQRSSSSKQ